MRWKDDEYKNLKYSILNILVFGLKKEHTIMMGKLGDAIDELFEKLTDREEI